MPRDINDGFTSISARRERKGLTPFSAQRSINRDFENSLDSSPSPSTRKGRNIRRAYRDLDVDDYSPSRRPRRSRTYSRTDDYNTQPITTSTTSRNRAYDTDNNVSSPTSRGRTYSSARDDYDDAGYEDYGEIGSNYDITKEPNYGYDYIDDDEYARYKDYEARTYAPEHKAPSTLDFSNSQPTRRTPSTPARNRGSAPNSLDFSNARTPSNTSRGYRQNSDDLGRYLNYLERYDKGDIDNHDMSRIQRAYANKPFWQTFSPSEDMIRKYGSGNRSTRWPMFRREGNRWVPEVWRND